MTTLTPALSARKRAMQQNVGNAELWKKLNFRCGLEIHHQILTEKKLFCHCPAGVYTDEWHAEALRHMRPTLSELGEYDGTALMEFKTKKEIIYRLNRNTVCTYEMDDNPPFLINDQAVDIALTIALALKCKIVGELHIIRKQYLDGSIPAGFQRTAIVGVDGQIELSSGKVVSIIQLGLEEDACREISDRGHLIIFSTDRLSMPIIEVVTGNNLATPEEAAEAGMRIGRLLRATQLVRRGMGSGRQDVNVSIESSTRVEIKGVPRIPRIPELTALEAIRQQRLIALRDRLQERGFKPGEAPGEEVPFKARPGDLNRPELSAALRAGDNVRVVKIPRSRKILNWELSGGRTFTDELAGRVQVIACLDQMPNLFHTDGPAGGLDPEDRERFAKAANLGPEDVAVIVYGKDEDTRTAAQEILIRFAEATAGVPGETRQALRNNATGFERILPGPDRMYPDTDSPPYEIADERVEEARKRVPEVPWVREERYRKLGLPEDVLWRLAISPYAALFDRLVKKKAVPPMLAGEVLTRFLVSARRKGADVTVLNEEHWETLLRALGSGTIFREGIYATLSLWCKTPEASLHEVIERLGMGKVVSDNDLEKTVKKAVAVAQQSVMSTDGVLVDVAMGEAMSELAGRIPGRKVRESILKVLA
ncbi:MAG: Glu-tRNA(Gln) amidotransferase subunit GatE [bacterium]